jgi:hypothetical protein
MSRPTTSCEERDAAILLLVHRNLEPMAALHLQSHLWQCDRCRRRRAQFAALTATLADATCPVHARGETFAGTSSGFPSSQILLVSVLALTIIISLIAAVRPWLPAPLPHMRRSALTAAHRAAPTPGTASLLPGVIQAGPRPGERGAIINTPDAIYSPGRKPDDGCTPGLPSDRCR